MKKGNECSGEVDFEVGDPVLEHQLGIARNIAESKAKYRKIAQAAIMRWVKDFQDGKIEIKSVDDLKKLIEMDIELQRTERKK